LGWSAGKIESAELASFDWEDSIRRFVSIALGALGMLAVALISAFIAMRLAIHGREAVVPPVTGLAVTEAAGAVAHQGLHMVVENRFYSADVPEGHVIAQDPPAGFHVRRDWPVRITESLGSPRVPIPNLVGQSERAALITIRQLGLEPSAVIHIPAPGEEDVVIAQTPAPDAGEMTSPRISMLVSDAETSQTAAYVMPSLAGLSYAAAAVRVEAAGLHLLAPDVVPVVPANPPAAPGSTTAAASTVTEAAAFPAPPTSGTVVAQSPAAGSRVQKGDVVRITLAHTAPAE
jgi:eukaryotic-like serine/threonine-protein kinase